MVKKRKANIPTSKKPTKEEPNKLLFLDWIDTYKESFNRIKRFSENDDWTKSDNPHEDYKSHLIHVKTSIKQLKYFTKNYAEFLKYKQSMEFINLAVEPLDEFHSRGLRYVEEHDWTLMEAKTPEQKDRRSEEIKFHDRIMQDTTLVYKALREMELKGKEIVIDIPIRGGAKMPLLMEERLETAFPQLTEYKEAVKGLNVANGVAASPRSTFDIHKSSTEFYINMKNPPVYDLNKHYYEQDQVVLDFYRQELDKIRNGVTIGGTFIHGWLYWHLNYFVTDIPKTFFKGTPLYDTVSATKKRIITNPILRDNELLFADHYIKAEKENKSLFMFGTRRFAKTVIESSMATWSLTKEQGCEGSIVGGSANDLEKLMATINMCFEYVNPAFRLPKLNNKADEVIIAGLKTGNEPITYGQMKVINVNKGKAGGELNAAGATPTLWVVDEFGKFSGKAMYHQALPSFGNEGGWGLVPLLTGCLTACNKVFTKEGNVVNIEDLKYEDGIVGFDVDAQEVSFEDITNINPPQEKECYYIETNKGTKVECSYDHPFLVKQRFKVETVFNEKGEKKRRRKVEFIHSEKLEKGMLLALPDEIPLKGNKKMWNPYFIGALIGDGNYSHNHCTRLSNEDSEVWNYVDTLNLDYTITRQRTTDLGRIYKEVRFRGVNKYLRELGIFGQTGKNKDLPTDIHLYKKEDIIEFLSGLYDTDGTVTDADKGDYKISITSVSKTLIESLKLLLIRLGIHSNIQIEKPDTRDRKIRSKNCLYVLNIIDTKSINRFIEQIPLKINRKQERLKKLYETLKTKGSRIDSNYPEMRFERIVKIEKVGLKPVYNLTTSTTHTYLANGVITHNTGGNEKLSTDAQEMLTNPEANSILPMDWDRLERDIEDKDDITWKRKSFGVFVPGQMSGKTGIKKIETTLADYLGVKSTKLKKIRMLRTDWKRAKEKLEEDLELKKNDKEAIKQELMGFPRDPNDCFMSNNDNPYPAIEAQLHKENLIVEGGRSRLVDLSKDPYQDKIIMTDSSKPLADYPHRGGNIDCAVQIFEPPPENPVWDFTYVAGLDHYKQDVSGTDSLGALYIVKRQVNIKDKFSNRIVASYVSKPDTMEQFNETAMYLLEAYGAFCLQEGIDLSLDKYLLERGKNWYLESGNPIVQDIQGKSASQNVKKGLSPTQTNIKYRRGIGTTYTNQNMILGEREDGTVLEGKGVMRVDDIGLLTEYVMFDYEANVDRIVAFEHALVLARHYDRTRALPENTMGYEDEYQDKQRRPTRKRSPYSTRRVSNRSSRRRR